MARLISEQKVRVVDTDLRRRAKAVIPGGMYGHLSANGLPADYPQFYERAEGSHLWDVDGNEYVDLMCSFGPIILGHRHPKVEAAVAAQLAKGDTMAGPGAAMVEAAEILVDRVAHADWAMFAKNGTDATNVSLMIARAATGRNKVLMARGAYHGWTAWSTLADSTTIAPRTALLGVPKEDRSNVLYYTFNDIASVEQAVTDAAGNVAAIFVSPHKSDAGFDNELVNPSFARQLRELCDRIGALLVIDEVRAGFRLNDGGSWEPIGVAPDLSAWSKGIGNGYAIASILGSDKYREAATQILTTGSFWFQAAPMAAVVATVTAIHDEGAVDVMKRIGTQLQEGIEGQAAEHGVEIRYTGAVQMPNVSFVGDQHYEKAIKFCGAVASHGVIVAPRHNWFVSSAVTQDDVERILEATDAGFEAVR